MSNPAVAARYGLHMTTRFNDEGKYRLDVPEVADSLLWVVDEADPRLAGAT